VNRPGHVGFTLALTAPVTLAFGRTGLVFTAVAAALSSAPDLDLDIPFMKHRGFSHTVFFTAALSLAAATMGAAVLAGTSPLATKVFLLLLAAALTGGLSHICADALTFSGVKPLAPVSNKKYGLGLFHASSGYNKVFLLTGIGAQLVAIQAAAV